MNKMKFMVLFMSIAMIFGSCGSMNNTGKGAAIGGGSGAALGAILGGVIGKGKGAAIGAAIGTAVGAGTGALIGKKMDKAAAEAKQIEGAQVATLSAAAKSALSKFANNVLNQNRDMDVSIYGYTDNQGWKNSTAAQSQQKNLNLSQERAQSVSSYLLSCGVSTNQIKGVQGMGESDPVASNDTAAGREQNRRVEVYMYASEQMIKDAQAAAN